MAGIIRIWMQVFFAFHWLHWHLTTESAKISRQLQHEIAVRRKDKNHKTRYYLIKLWSYHFLFLVNPVIVLQHLPWKLYNFPNYFESLPQTSIICSKICWFTRFSLTVAGRIYALFVAKSTSVPGLGGGGLSQSWQCQDFGSASHRNPSLSHSSY